MARNGSTDSGKGSDSGGKDDPVGHDFKDDKGGSLGATSDDPAGPKADVDKRMDDPLTHDIGDDHGVDDPLTHDIGDDHGFDQLKLVLNPRTGQWIFTDDESEHQAWLDDHGQDGAKIDLHTPQADDQAVSVWRFHDEASDVYF